MARLGFLEQMLWGDHADRAAINRTADELANVEATVGELEAVVKRQAQEIVQLRAMFMGIASLLHEKHSFSEAELEQAVKASLAELSPPPPPPKASSTDPYRGTSGGDEASPGEIEAAKALLKSAQDLHFGKQFAEAKVIYKQIVEQYPNTKQATTARQQLANLR